MLYHTKGGFGWTETYNMPIWLRRFYHTKLAEQLKAEGEANEKASRGKSGGKVHRGPFG